MSAMSIAEIGIDAATPGDMAGIVGICEGEAFEHAELRFNLLWVSKRVGSGAVATGQESEDGRCAGCPESPKAAFAGSNGAGSKTLC
jgi:hypothetical protein